MTAQWRVVQRWSAQLVTLTPGIRVTRARTLAWLVMGMIWAGSVSLPKIAAALPGPTRDASRVRRLTRWLKNDAVEVEAIWRRLRPALLAERAGQEVTLVLDLSPHGTAWTMLVIGVVTHRRALPIAGRIVPQQRPWETSLRVLVTEVCGQIAAAVPPGCAVTLLSDRGLTGPSVIDACRALGWHWVGRVNVGPAQANRMRDPTGAEDALWAWVRRQGRGGTRAAALFKQAGWRQGFVTVHRHPRYAEPWVLFSDRPGGFDRVREYRRRWRIESMFQDCKRRGLNVEGSRLTDPQRLTRLLPALHLALWWLHQLGARAIRHGERARFDRSDRRDLSLIRLGRRVMETRLAANRPPPLPFSRGVDGWRYVSYHQTVRL